MKALERIPLPPKAGDNDNSSVDLYVSKGLDTPGRPELTDPALREEYGFDDRTDRQMNELPTSAPQKRADIHNPPNIDPEGNPYSPTGIYLPDQSMRNQAPVITPDEYQKELSNRETRPEDAQRSSDTNDNIDEQSTGAYKDPFDLDGKQIAKPELGNTALKYPHAGPRNRQDDIVEDTEDSVPTPDDRLYMDSAGSKPDPKGKAQVLGSPDDDDPPVVPSEGDPRDYNQEELEKSINLQQRKITTESIPKQQNAEMSMGKDDFIVLPDPPEKQNR